MDPPQCVQNAMMTKDRKPFTYTPGGIDLSQVRSPRMQRRIERNAHLGENDEQAPKPHPAHNYGPLPPSALAAMRPQTQVQVFPGPPPPPPMQKNIPPPPPPPCAPLPTQKVTTGENQVIERPDMTKIIPDNPMSLLRRTGRPAPRKLFSDQTYEDQDRPNNVYQPPVAVSPVVQPQQYRRPPQQQFQTTPPYSQNDYQPDQPTYQQQREAPRSPGYPPVSDRQPVTPPIQKNVGSNIGSLYIPPINQQQQKVASPPSPPQGIQEQEAQSPGTPTLKEAPRPWQQKNVQPELPPWARKDDNDDIPTQSVPDMQRRWQPETAQQPVKQQFAPKSPQSQTPPNQAYPANSFPIQIEIRTGVPHRGDAETAERKPDAVYVTKPVILQHPGPGFEPVLKIQSKQQPARAQEPVNHYEQAPNQYQPPKQQAQSVPKVDTSGTRIIPIQIERTPPSTPSGERNLNRQMSWGNQQPTQSNSFKAIQKFTKTEYDDGEEDDTPVTRHSARFPREMPEQPRRMKVHDNGQFRQGNDGHPSRPTYVHPSEQVAPEPKKYTGSNIPSRSFKILQAMTAPADNNNCANANDDDDDDDEPKSNPTYYYPYAPYPPPYWPDFPPEERSDPDEKRPPTFQPYRQDYYAETSDRRSRSGSSTPVLRPVPYWMPPPYAARPQTCKEQRDYPIFPPYFVPCYFGYPPLLVRSNDRHSGYTENGLENGVQVLRRQFEIRSESATPKITVTPTHSKGDALPFNVPPDKKDEDFENALGLRSIKSVQNVNVYNDNFSSESEYETSDDDDDDDETSEENTSLDQTEEDAIIPRQLSVIYEESESRRCNSACGESTATAEHQSEVEEDEDFLASQNVEFKIKMFQGTAVSAKEERKVFSAFSSNKTPENMVEDVEEVVIRIRPKIKRTGKTEETDDAKTDSDVIAKDAKEMGRVEAITDAKDDLYDAPEEIPRGTLMKIDSFASQFEAIRWNSGLWNINLLGKPEDLIDEEATKSAEENAPAARVDDKMNLECKAETTVEEEKSLSNSSGNKDVEDKALEPVTRIDAEISLDCKAEEVEDNKDVEDGSSAESEVDFWSQIKTDDDDDFTPRRKSFYRREEDDNRVDSSSSCDRAVDSSQQRSVESCSLNTVQNKSEDESEEEASITENNESELNFSESEGQTSVEVEIVTNCHCDLKKIKPAEEEAETSSSQSEGENGDVQSTLDSGKEQESHTDQIRDRDGTSRSKSAEPQTIKERIEALRNSITRKQRELSGKETASDCVKTKVYGNGESLSKTTSTKSSVKSFEEYSEEEEPDSGVISDISRHISDNEDFPELRKMTRYERAATHSRLFKLLQGECGAEENYEVAKEDKFSKLSVRKNGEPNRLAPSRSKLSLPLVTKSAEVATVNENLVEELVQSLLRSRKAQLFRNMPKEKLYAAAVKILREGAGSSETPPEEFSGLLSPLRGDTENSSPAQTPQEFYGDGGYGQYYDTWSDAASEIMPSKAFKVLQERLGGNRVGAIEGASAKCPRILTSKTSEGGGGSDCSGPGSHPLPEANGVTDT